MAVRNSRNQYRRGRFGFLYKVLSILLILAAVVGGCIVFFRVEEIRIEGSTVYSDEEIIAAAGVEPGDNLFLIRRVQIGRKIINQLPYIDEVNPRSVLPSTLLITVTECTAAGVLKGEDGTWWVLDSSCKILEQGGSELTKQYPIITGLTALMPSEGGKLAVSAQESTKLDSLKELLTALNSRDMLGQLQKVDLSGISEIHMTYDGRFDVRMPMYSDDVYLLVHTLQEVAAYLDDGQTGTIDLTGERARFIPD